MDEEYQKELSRLEQIYGAGRVPEYELKTLNSKHKMVVDLTPGSKASNDLNAFYGQMPTQGLYGGASDGVDQLAQKEIDAFAAYDVKTDPRKYDEMVEQRAANQSTGEQIGHAVAKFVPNVALGFVEQTADALDLPGYFNQEEEVGNWLSNKVRGWKEGVNEYLPIYTAKDSSFLPGKNFDSGALINMLSSVAESGLSFALTGSALNKGLQFMKAASGGKGVAGLLGEAANLAAEGSQTEKTFEGAANFLNAVKNKTGFGSQELAIAYATNQAENVGIAADTYNNTFAKLKAQGYTEDYAKQVAGSAAQQAMELNRANFMLNLTGAKAITGGSLSVNRANRTLFERLFNTGAADLTQEGIGVAEKGIMRSIWHEGIQEYVEENINTYAQNLAEKYGEDLAAGKVEKRQSDFLDMIGGRAALNDVIQMTPFYGDLFNQSFLTRKGWEDGISGFIGGGGQVGFTKANNALMDSKLGQSSRYASIFGNKQVARHTEDVFDEAGNLIARKGDAKYRKENLKSDKDIMFAEGDVAREDITYKSTADDGSIVDVVIPKGSKITEEQAKELSTNNIARVKKGEDILDKDNNPLQRDTQDVEYEKDAKGRIIYKSGEEDVRRHVEEVTAKLKQMQPHLMSAFTSAEIQSNITNSTRHIDDFLNGNVPFFTELSDEEKEGAKGAIVKSKLNDIAKTFATLANPNLDVESDAGKAAVEQERKKLTGEGGTTTYSRKEMNEKREMLNNHLLAEQAYTMFSKGASEGITQIYESIMNLKPEEASSLGYSENYKANAKKALDNIKKYRSLYEGIQGRYDEDLSKELYTNRVHAGLLADLKSDLDNRLTEQKNKLAQEKRKEVMSAATTNAAGETVPEVTRIYDTIDQINRLIEETRAEAKSLDDAIKETNEEFAELLLKKQELLDKISEEEAAQRKLEISDDDLEQGYSIVQAIIDNNVKRNESRERVINLKKELAEVEKKISQIQKDFAKKNKRLSLRERLEKLGVDSMLADEIVDNLNRAIELEQGIKDNNQKYNDYKNTRKSNKNSFIESRKAAMNYRREMGYKEYAYNKTMELFTQMLNTQEEFELHGKTRKGSYAIVRNESASNKESAKDLMHLTINRYISEIYKAKLQDKTEDEIKELVGKLIAADLANPNISAEQKALFNDAQTLLNNTLKELELSKNNVRNFANNYNTYLKSKKGKLVKVESADGKISYYFQEEVAHEETVQGDVAKEFYESQTVKGKKLFKVTRIDGTADMYTVTVNEDVAKRNTTLITPANISEFDLISPVQNYLYDSFITARNFVGERQVKLEFVKNKYTAAADEVNQQRLGVEYMMDQWNGIADQIDAIMSYSPDRDLSNMPIVGIMNAFDVSTDDSLLKLYQDNLDVAEKEFKTKKDYLDKIIGQIESEKKKVDDMSKIASKTERDMRLIKTLKAKIDSLEILKSKLEAELVVKQKVRDELAADFTERKRVLESGNAETRQAKITEFDKRVRLFDEDIERTKTMLSNVNSTLAKLKSLLKSILGNDLKANTEMLSILTNDNGFLQGMKDYLVKEGVAASSIDDLMNTGDVEALRKALLFLIEDSQRKDGPNVKGHSQRIAIAKKANRVWEYLNANESKIKDSINERIKAALMSIEEKRSKLQEDLLAKNKDFSFYYESLEELVAAKEKYLVDNAKDVEVMREMEMTRKARIESALDASPKSKGSPAINEKIFNDILKNFRKADLFNYLKVKDYKDADAKKSFFDKFKETIYAKHKAVDQALGGLEVMIANAETLLNSNNTRLALLANRADLSLLEVSSISEQRAELDKTNKEVIALLSGIDNLRAEILQLKKKNVSERINDLRDKVKQLVDVVKYIKENETLSANADAFFTEILDTYEDLVEKSKDTSSLDDATLDETAGDSVLHLLEVKSENMQSILKSTVKELGSVIEDLDAQLSILSKVYGSLADLQKEAERANDAIVGTTTIDVEEINDANEAGDVDLIDPMVGVVPTGSRATPAIANILPPDDAKDEITETPTTERTADLQDDEEVLPKGEAKDKDNDVITVQKRLSISNFANFAFMPIQFESVFTESGVRYIRDKYDDATGLPMYNKANKTDFAMQLLFDSIKSLREVKVDGKMIMIDPTTDLSVRYIVDNDLNKEDEDIIIFYDGKEVVLGEYGKNNKTKNPRIVAVLQYKDMDISVEFNKDDIKKNTIQFNTSGKGYKLAATTHTTEHADRYNMEEVFFGAIQTFARSIPELDSVSITRFEDLSILEGVLSPDSIVSLSFKQHKDSATSDEQKVERITFDIPFQAIMNSFKKNSNINYAFSKMFGKVKGVDKQVSLFGVMTNHVEVKINNDRQFIKSEVARSPEKSFVAKVDDLSSGTEKTMRKQQRNDLTALIGETSNRRRHVKISEYTNGDIELVIVDKGTSDEYGKPAGSMVAFLNDKYRLDRIHSRQLSFVEALNYLKLQALSALEADPTVVVRDNKDNKKKASKRNIFINKKDAKKSDSSYSWASLLYYFNSKDTKPFTLITKETDEKKQTVVLKSNSKKGKNKEMPLERLMTLLSNNNLTPESLAKMKTEESKFLVELLTTIMTTRSAAINKRLIDANLDTYQHPVAVVIDRNNPNNSRIEVVQVEKSSKNSAYENFLLNGAEGVENFLGSDLVPNVELVKANIYPIVSVVNSKDFSKYRTLPPAPAGSRTENKKGKDNNAATSAADRSIPPLDSYNPGAEVERGKDKSKASEEKSESGKTNANGTTTFDMTFDTARFQHHGLGTEGENVEVQVKGKKVTKGNIETIVKNDKPMDVLTEMILPDGTTYQIVSRYDPVSNSMIQLSHTLDSPEVVEFMKKQFVGDASIRAIVADMLSVHLEGHDKESSKTFAEYYSVHQDELDADKNPVKTPIINVYVVSSKKVFKTAEQSDKEAAKAKEDAAKPQTIVDENESESDEVIKKKAWYNSLNGGNSVFVMDDSKNFIVHRLSNGMVLIETPKSKTSTITNYYLLNTNKPFTNLSSKEDNYLVFTLLKNNNEEFIWNKKNVENWAKVLNISVEEATANIESAIAEFKNSGKVAKDNTEIIEAETEIPVEDAKAEFNSAEDEANAAVNTLINEEFGTSDMPVEEAQAELEDEAEANEVEIVDTPVEAPVEEKPKKRRNKITDAVVDENKVDSSSSSLSEIPSNDVLDQIKALNEKRNEALKLTEFTKTDLFQDRNGNKFISEGTVMSSKGREVLDTKYVESFLREGDEITFYQEKWRSGVYKGDKIRDDNDNPWGLIGALMGTNAVIINETRKKEINDYYNNEINKLTNSNQQSNKSESVEEKVDNDKPVDDNSAHLDLRISTSKQYNREDVQAAKSFIEKAFGGNVNVSIEDAAKAKMLADTQQMGYFAGNTIHLFSNAEEGTVYHEALHAVFALYLSPKEIRNVLEELRGRVDYNSRIYTVKKLYAKQGVILSQLKAEEEILAEEFRDWVMSEGTMKVPDTTRKTVFEKLWNFIKSLFGIKNWDTSFKPSSYTEELYSNIVNSKYAKPYSQNRFKQESEMKRIVVSPATFTATYTNKEGKLIDVELPVEHLHNHINAMRLMYFKQLIDEPTYKDITAKSFGNININALNQSVVDMYDKADDNVDADTMRILMSDVSNFNDVKSLFMADLKRQFNHLLQDEKPDRNSEKDGDENAVENRNSSTEIMSSAKINTTDLIPPIIRSLIYSLREVEIDETGMPVEVETKDAFNRWYKNSEGVYVPQRLKYKIYKEKTTSLGLPIPSDYVRIERFLTDKFKNKIEPSISQALEHLINLSNRQGDVKNRGLYSLNQLVKQLHEYYTAAVSTPASTSTIGDDINTAVDKEYKAMNAYNILSKFVIQFTNFAPTHLINVLDEAGEIRSIPADSEKAVSKLIALSTKQLSENFETETGKLYLTKPFVDKLYSFVRFNSRVANFVPSEEEVDAKIQELPKFFEMLGITFTSFDSSVLPGILANHLKHILFSESQIKAFKSDFKAKQAILRSLSTKVSVIETIANTIASAPNLTEADKVKLSNLYNDKELIKNMSIRTFLSSVLELDAENSSEVTSSQYLIGGESRFGIQRYTAQGNTIMSFNQYAQEAFTNFPVTSKMTDAEKEAVYEKRMDYVAQYVPEILTITSLGSRWIDEAIKNGTIINIGIDAGLTSSETDAKETPELAPGEKLMTQIANSFNGYNSFSRAADRSVENVIAMVSRIGKKAYNFISPEQSEENDGIITEHWTDYLASELLLVMKYRDKTLSYAKNKYLNSKLSGKSDVVGNAKRGDFLRFWDGIASDALLYELATTLFSEVGKVNKAAITDKTSVGKKAFLEAKTSKIPATYASIQQALRENKGLAAMIKRDLAKFIEEQTQSTVDRAIDLGLTRKAPLNVEYDSKTKKKKFVASRTYLGIPDSMLTTFLSEKAASISVNENRLKELMKFYTINQMMSIIEQSKTFLGDPATYKNLGDWDKRMSGSNSTKDRSMVLIRDKSDNHENNYFESNVARKLTFMKLNEKGIVTERQSLVPINNVKADTETYKTVTEMLRKVAMTSDVNAKQSLMNQVFAYVFAMTEEEVKATKPESFRFLAGYGWRIDGKENNNTIHTALFDDVDTISSYYLDKAKVDSLVISEGNKITYLDKEGKAIAESDLSPMRKAYTRAVLQDGIKNASALLKKVNGYMKPYLGLTEADAQGMVTLDEWKSILQRGKSWTNGHQKVYEKAVLGLPLSKTDLFYIQPLKTQHYGPVDDYLKRDVKNNSVREDRAYVNGFYKHSLTPLIPSIVKGTPLEKLMFKMIEQKVGIAQYKSAMKVGFEGLNPFYNENGEFPDTPLKTQDIDYKYIGIQVNIAAKVKTHVTSGTQQNKNLDHNIYNFGNIRNDEFSDMITPVVKDGELIRVSNDEAKEIQLNKRSKLVNLTAELGFYELAAEIDLRIINDEKVQIGNMAKLIDILQEGNSSTNQNTIDSINYLRTVLDHRDGRTPFFDEIMDSAKLQNIIHSILNSRMINLERNGGAKPQVSVTGRETESRVLWVNDKGQLVQKGAKGSGKDGKAAENIGEGLEMAASTKLKFYSINRNGNKISVAETMLGLPKEWFGWVESVGGLDAFNAKIAKVHAAEDSHLDSNSDLTFEQYLRSKISEENEESIDSTSEKMSFLEMLNLHKLTRVLGYRIPHQAYSSTDVMRVKQFLPVEFGDGVVVPAEIVAKAGSDFDIDKMTMYFYNFVKNGKEISVDGLIRDMSEEAVMDRYMSYVFNSVNKKKLDEEIKEIVKTEAKLGAKSQLESAGNLYEYREMLKSVSKEENDLNRARTKAMTQKSSQIFFNMEEMSKTTDSENAADLEVMAKFVETAKAKGDLRKGFEQTIMDWIVLAEEYKSYTSSPVISKAYTDLIESYNDIIGVRFNKKTVEKLSAITAQLDSTLANKSEILKKIQAETKALKIEAQKAQSVVIGEMLAAKLKNPRFIYENFKNASYEEQLPIEKLQNELLDAELDIITNVSNFRQLTAPIDDSVFKDEESGALTQNRFIKSNSPELKEVYALRETKLKKFIENYEKINGMAPTEMEKGTYLGLVMMKPYLEAMNKWRKNAGAIEKDKVALSSSILNVPGQLDKFIFFLSGKGGVGQTAVHVTHHALSQKSGLRTTVSFEITSSGEIKSMGGWNIPINLVRVSGDKQIALKAPLSKYEKDDASSSYNLYEYTSENGNIVKGKVLDSIPFDTRLYTSFAGYQSIEGNFVITEVLSSFLTAYVDIAKDPYIFELNAGNSVANTVMMMVRAGTPTDYIVKLITSKSIVDYVSNQQSNESVSNKAAGIESENYVVKLNTALKFVNSDKNVYKKLFGDIYKTFGRVDLNSAEFIDYIKENRMKVLDMMHEINKFGSEYSDDKYRSKISAKNEVDLFDEYIGLINKKRVVNYILDTLLPKSTEQTMFSDAVKDIIEDPLKSDNAKRLEVELLSSDRERKMSNARKDLDLLSSFSFETFANPSVTSGEDYDKFQLAVLDTFLTLQEKSKGLQKLIRATSPDTRGNMADIKSNGNDLEMLNQVFIENQFVGVERILENSPISGFYLNKQRGYAIGKELLLAESDETVKAVMDVMVSELTKGASSTEKEKITKRIQEHFKMFLLHADLGNGTNVNAREVFESYLQPKGDKLVYKVGKKSYTLPGLLGLMQAVNGYSNTAAKEKSIMKIAKALEIENEDCIEIFKTLFDNPFLKSLEISYATEPRSYREIQSDQSQSAGDRYIDTVSLVSKKLGDEERNILISQVLDFKTAVDAAMDSDMNGTDSGDLNIFNALLDVIFATQGTIRSPRSLYELLPPKPFTDRISPQVSAFLNMNTTQKKTLMTAFASQFIRNQHQLATRASVVKKMGGMVPTRKGVEELTLAFEKVMVDREGFQMYSRPELESGSITSIPTKTFLFTTSRGQDGITRVAENFVGIRDSFFGYTYFDRTFNNRSYVKTASQLSSVNIDELNSLNSESAITITIETC